MQIAEPSLEYRNLVGFSDKELIRSYCAISPPREQHPTAQALANELWRRHGDTVVYGALRSLARSPGMVPGSHQGSEEWKHAAQTFVDTSFTQAYLNFTQRLDDFRLDDPRLDLRFPAWLRQVARTAALDVRRQMVGRPISAGKQCGEVVGPTAATPKEPGLPEKKTRRRVFEELDEMILDGLPPDVLDKISDRERKFMVQSLLRKHAEESAEGAESCFTIDLHWWHEWSVPKLAVYFFGESTDTKARKSNEDKIYKRLHEDYHRLQALAADEFRILGLHDT